MSVPEFKRDIEELPVITKGRAFVARTVRLCGNEKHLYRGVCKKMQDCFSIGTFVFLNVPSSLVSADTDISAPFRKAHSSSFNGNEFYTPSVCGLLGKRNKPTVIWGIPSVVVNSVDAQPFPIAMFVSPFVKGRSLSHSLQMVIPLPPYRSNLILFLL